MKSVGKGARRLLKNEKGSVGMMYALLMVPMIGLMALAVDWGRAVKVQSRAQQAVDMAVLAAMREHNLTAGEREQIATAYFNANFKEDAALRSKAVPKFTFNEDGTMTATVDMKVKTMFGQFVSKPFISADSRATVLAEQGNGQKVEIGMMIDLTGSMGSTRNGSTKINGLKTAAADLLDILYPSGDNPNVRVAIAPMADYVNAGEFASAVTGLPQTGSYARGDNLTSTKQGRFSGSYSGFYGNNQPVGSQHGATSASSGGATYNNEYCTAGNEYETRIRYNTPRWVGRSASRYEAGAIRAYGWYSKEWKWSHGGGYWDYEYHYDDDGDWIVRTRSSSCSEAADQSGKLITCVTERTNLSTRYTDAAPSTLNYVGPYNQSASLTTNKLNYSADGKCYVGGRELPAVIPLTSSKSQLATFFDEATIGGSTPGHLGHAWAWYLISPRWNSILPGASQPAQYEDTGTRKIAIIMTDGEYNTQYSSATSKAQALALCQGMKDENITVYTIGFGFSTSATAGDGSSEGNIKQMLTQCSSGDNHYYFPYDSNALKQVFQSIGEGIMGQSAVASSLKLVD